jgi:hypothetical protein
MIVVLSLVQWHVYITISSATMNGLGEYSPISELTAGQVARYNGVEPRNDDKTVIESQEY